MSMDMDIDIDTDIDIDMDIDIDIDMEMVHGDYERLNKTLYVSYHSDCLGN